MRRRLVHAFLVLMLGTVPALLGIVAALILTPPGRRLVAREVSRALDGVLNGDLEIGALHGSFIFGLRMDDVTLRDTSGVLFARVPHLEVSYQLPNLLAGRILLNRVRLEQPEFNVIKHPGGRMNYEDILRLGQGPGGGTPPLVELRDVRIDQATLRIATPWNPPDTLRTAAGREAALAAERAKPGRVIENSPEGLRKIVTAAALSARLPLVRLSSPLHQPVTIQADSLAAVLSDPAITLRDFTGRILVQGDSVVVSALHGALPNTEFAGGGTVHFPSGNLLYDLSLDIPQLDLRDVRWVTPAFPAMTGSALLTANSISPSRTDFVVRKLHLRGGPGSVDGALTVIQDARRGLGMRDLDVTLRQLDLDAVRGFLDTLPFYGRVTGTLQADGFFDRMQVALEWAFADARVPGQPVTRLAGEGAVTLGGPDGLAFHEFMLDSSSIDLATVRRLAPAVVLHGRGRLAGVVDGAWKDVTFTGHLEHQDDSLPVSAADGTVHLDTRGAVLGLDADVHLAPLAFDGIRPAFPSLKTRGRVSGHFEAHGTLALLRVDADLTGALGSVRVRGPVTLEPPHWGADSVRVEFHQLDLAALRGHGPETSLNGQLLASGDLDTLRAPDGFLQVTLDSSWIREFLLDSARAVAAVRDSVLHLDTLEVSWDGGADSGRVAGSGTLGWVRPHSGRLSLSAQSVSLAPFDSLLTALSGLGPDTSALRQPLSGYATAQVTLTGSLDSLHAETDVGVQQFAWREYQSPALEGTLVWDGGRRARLQAVVRSDSLAAGGATYRTLRASLGGWADSLAWAGSLGAGRNAEVSGGGTWWTRGSGWVLGLDTLTLALPDHDWRLRRPTLVRVDSQAVALDSLALMSGDGSGHLLLNGALPRKSPGQLRVEARGIDLRDIYALLQRDTAGVGGEVSLDLDLSGTAAAPSFSGEGTLGDVVFGDFHAPFVQGVFRYRDRLLDANLLLWKTGVQVLRVEARLPLNLALAQVKQREVAGDLYVHAQADSVDLALLEAFTPNLRRVEGLLKADIEVTGAWEAPRLSGYLETVRGAATVPALGVRYGYLASRFRFTGDSIVVERLRTTSGAGFLTMGGYIRLANLTHPVLNLELQATRFMAINDPTFLTLELDGRMGLTGPVFGATLAGNVTARSGVLHFADLVTKRIVDLSDPLGADLIDTSFIKAQRLGPQFQSIFLDSLHIRDLTLSVQDQFWLRSSDANIQLEGTITVNKTGGNYRFDGTLTALRGTYTLKVGFVTRDFDVNRGTVRYFGTPDLNAELNISATHTVQSDGEDIPVIAQITGTLLQPKLTLTTTLRPAPSETELMSYLMFGRPSPELPALGSGQNAQRAAALEAGLAYLSSALSSEIQRTLVSDVGIPIDFVEIRTGSSPLSGATGLTQVAAGWQLGNKAFFTINAGVCRADLGNLSTRSLGASLEYRLTHVWRFQTSFEPIIDCRPTGTVTYTNSSLRYQFGVDALWEKEY